MGTNCTPVVADEDRGLQGLVMHADALMAAYPNQSMQSLMP